MGLVNDGDLTVLRYIDQWDDGRADKDDMGKRTVDLNCLTSYRAGLYITKHIFLRFID